MNLNSDGGDNELKVCFLSNFPPKECGIATFTQDLVTSINKKFNPKVKSRVVALDDGIETYNYDSRVILHFDRENINEYIRVAEKINNSKNIKLVCIQHEFGIFGGEYGKHLIHFLKTIRKPVVITFHSVLPSPNKLRKKIVSEICSKASGIIVMSKKAVEILNKDYGVEKSKLYVVPHGIPNVPFLSEEKREKLKRKMKLGGKKVLLTFGLLSRGKGIEYVIRALPNLVKKYPNLIYLVIGETHPVVRKEEGESYRRELMREIKKLGLENNVKFYNKYLTKTELLKYLLASDIYLCTNLDPNQIVSGTLSYALGCGKAIISTRSLYSEEILAEGRGIIVEAKKPSLYEEALERILSDDKFREELERRAYYYSRHMIWQNIALKYFSIFNEVVKLSEEIVEKYPPIKLKHLRTLTDDFGIVQFAHLDKPDKFSGYTVDDNSRALIVSILHNKITKSRTSKRFAKIYLNFLEHAQDERGWFHNFHYNEKIKGNEHSEDAFGRAMWALGYAISETKSPVIKEKAKNLFDKAINLIEKIRFLRSKAFLILGLYYYSKKYKKAGNYDIKLLIKKLADSLVEAYKRESSKEWKWFEEKITYSNTKIPESLLLAYDLTKEKKYLEVAEESLQFLIKILFVNGKLYPIGEKGWYNRNGKRALFDQQPVDASACVQTFLTAYKITKNEEYLKKAIISFNWFLGKNHLNQVLYNEETGGCFDGLLEECINLNQGAESTLSYLLARLHMEEFKKFKEN